MRCRSF